jgi:hypothetical protein
MERLRHFRCRLTAMRLKSKKVCSACLVIAGCLMWAIAALAGKKAPFEQSELDAIAARGRLLYEYDQAAWHSTDAVMAANPDRNLVNRFVGRKLPDGRWEVDYGSLNPEKTVFRVFYMATQQTGTDKYDLKHLETPAEDTGFLLTAARAIELTRKSFAVASAKYNTAVLPNPDSTLAVFFYPAQTEKNMFLYGADTRFIVSSDGMKVLEKQGLHRSLLHSDTGSTQKVVTGIHSHILTDVPVETDVLLVLERQPAVEEYVACKDRMFVVKTDGTIQLGRR